MYMGVREGGDGYLRIVYTCVYVCSTSQLIIRGLSPACTTDKTRTVRQWLERWPFAVAVAAAASAAAAEAPRVVPPSYYYIVLCVARDVTLVRYKRAPVIIITFYLELQCDSMTTVAVATTIRRTTLLNSRINVPLTRAPPRHHALPESCSLSFHCLMYSQRHSVTISRIQRNDFYPALWVSAKTYTIDFWII